MSYFAVIGMEIHAELATRTKMFCASLNDPFISKPNTNICPVCLALPGSLPTLNTEAIKMLVSLASDLDSEVKPITKWDRKNYFYPDLPKGYQISQYDQPLLTGGKIELSENEVWPLTRIHLEEDTAKLIHSSDGSSLIDHNRAGVPLAELVTEPIIVNLEDAPRIAKKFCEIYQFMLQRRGISNADMEKGEMRCEANVSVIRIKNQELRIKNATLRVANTNELSGAKVEVKNLNSFRAVERAIKFEIDRQIKALEAGEKLVQETRGWDEARQQTISQRAKETSAEYRYFPEPDLPTINPRVMFDLDNHPIVAEPFPHELAKQLINNYYLSVQDAERFAINAKALADLGEIIDLAEGKKEVVKIAATILMNFNTAQSVAIMALVEIAKLIDSSELSKHHIRSVLDFLANSERSVAQIIKEEGLSIQSNEGEITQIIQKVIQDNVDAVEKYRAGKHEVVGFLIGQVMKAVAGKFDPTIVRNLLLKELG